MMPTRQEREYIMRMALAVTAALIGTTSAAHAEEPKVYIAAFGGIDMPDDERLDGTNADGQLRDIDVLLGDDSVVGLALGVATPEQSFGRFRGEIEASFRQSDLGGLTLNGVAREVLDGSHVSVAAAMVNLSYDTPQLFDRLRFTAGAGFGVAAIDHQIRYLIAVPPAIGAFPGNVQIAIPSTETTHAYQLIGGAEFALNKSFSLTADVRYFDLGNVQAERFILNSFIGGVPTTIGTLDSILDADYATTSFTVGIRYQF